MMTISQTTVHARTVLILVATRNVRAPSGVQHHAPGRRCYDSQRTSEEFSEAALCDTVQIRYGLAHTPICPDRCSVVYLVTHHASLSVRVTVHVVAHSRQSGHDGVVYRHWWAWLRLPSKRSYRRHLRHQSSPHRRFERSHPDRGARVQQPHLHVLTPSPSRS
jgi:hypothetical protein